MDDVKAALLGDHEAAKRLTDAGYFKASGDLALCRCPFCGSEDVVYERYLHTAGYRWRVVCTSCMASIDPGYAHQRSTVQRMWNTRASILSAEEFMKLEESGEEEFMKLEESGEEDVSSALYKEFRLDTGMEAKP